MKTLYWFKLTASGSLRLLFQQVIITYHSYEHLSRYSWLKGGRINAVPLYIVTFEEAFFLLPVRLPIVTVTVLFASYLTASLHKAGLLHKVIFEQHILSRLPINQFTVAGGSEAGIDLV